MKKRIVSVAILSVAIVFAITIGLYIKSGSDKDAATEESVAVAETEESTEASSEASTDDSSSKASSDSSSEANTEASSDEASSTEASTTAESTEETFKSYKRFTNTKCNIRADATKNSELIGTADVNTEITVTGVKGDWSAISYNGMTGYIKSSLLSKTKVEVKASTKSDSKSSSKSSAKQSGSSSAVNTPASTPSSNQDSDDNSSDDNINWSALDGAPTVGDMTVGGTTGNDGNTGSGHGMNFE